MDKKILIVSDNVELTNAFSKLVASFHNLDITYSYSYNNPGFANSANLQVTAEAVHVKEQWRDIVHRYDLVISLHCKQLFPAELVANVRCVNVHPGFNPYNRGWFPQVFSILNGYKAGATIHEIDEQLDHGAIIAQREIVIEKWDTSLTAYEKIQQLEIELLRENLESIIAGTYKAVQPEEEGNVNLKKDFNNLCAIDLQKQTTLGEAIDYLRAMTHGNYNNAYFIDPQTGVKVFVKITLEIAPEK
ncbi:MAG TPA: dTDP-4-amino-4,6-dideoxyglucose formyltransferase [Chitinophagales bacterium]|nr:dTDP-4-amino-4,6-dideoxyglucose formyltransferase [Chitinophagales bacterium]